MLDILLGIGQFLSVMALVYGVVLTAGYRESSEQLSARVPGYGSGHDGVRGRHGLRPHRAASRAIVSR